MTSKRGSARAPGSGREGSGARCPYGLCDGSGFVIDFEANSARRCECMPARVARRLASRLQGRIPTRYEGVSFERPPISELPQPVLEALRAYTHDISASLAEGRGLWVVGDVGTGKTSVAMLVSKLAIAAGQTVAIYSLPRLLNLLREEIAHEAGVLALLDDLTAVDLLHIDDLGAHHSTGWALEQLYLLIDARYQAGRAIVATTNVKDNELHPDGIARQLAAPLLGSKAAEGADQAMGPGGHLGARIVSRLIEICGDPLPLFGDDLRRPYRARGSLTLP
ncbi:MAG TPA: ATP-binding protein [Solirubrobacteraceae bacterium]|nr:ATP-binding protein [Solirubrobacteraceae bacterium]